MSTTIHCTVLKQNDVRVDSGRLCLTLFNDRQEFNIEPSAMVRLGLELIEEGHRQIIEMAKHNEAVMDELWNRVSEYEKQEDTA